MKNGLTNDEINTIGKFIESTKQLKMIKPGHIEITDKVYFEYYELEKPEKPKLCLKWHDDKTGCGLYICGYCKREFKATYIAYSKSWTVSISTH